MRWSFLGLLLLGLAILGTSACKVLDKPQFDRTSQRFPLTRLLNQDSSRFQCPVTEHKDPPKLLDITAYGLEGPQWWVPGQAVKVNWQIENPTRIENYTRSFVVRLRRHGSGHDEYVLELKPGPSSVSFPEPGCWVLTVERAGERAESTLFIRPDTPRALVLSGSDGVPPPAQARQMTIRC